jgi:hypothetical protein
MATVAIEEPKSLDQILKENPDLKNAIENKYDNVIMIQQALRSDINLVLYIVVFISIAVVLIYLRRKDIFKSSKFIPIYESSYHSPAELQVELSKDYYLSNSAYNCGFRKCLKCSYLVGNKHELANCPVKDGAVGPSLHYLDTKIIVLKYNNSNHGLSPDYDDKVCCKHCGIVISIDELKNGVCLSSGKRHESDGEVYDGKFMKIL